MRACIEDERMNIERAFLDGLRGATSERVLRRSRCPVVNLPVGSMLG